MKKLQHQKYPERLGSITASTAVGAWSGLIMRVSLMYRMCVYHIMLSMLIFRTRDTGPCWLPTCGSQTIISTHGHGRGWPWRGRAGQPSGDEEDGACPKLQTTTCCISHAGPAGWETAGTQSLFSQILHPQWYYFVQSQMTECRCRSSGRR